MVSRILTIGKLRVVDDREESFAKHSNRDLRIRSQSATDACLRLLGE